MSDRKTLEAAITPDKEDAQNYYIGRQAIPKGSPADQLLGDFQASQRLIFDHSTGPDREKQLAVLADVRAGKLPADKELVSPTHVTAEQLLARAKPDRDGNIHIGALTIDKSLYDEVSKALKAEGPKDPEMVALFEKMANDKTREHHVRRTDGADHNAPGGDINWDPAHGGVDYYNEAKMSPARALKHEAVHATQDPLVQSVLIHTPDANYNNLEEKNAEVAEARGMDGKLMRRSHTANDFYTADGPTGAPQVCDFGQFSVHTQPNGQGPLKGPGSHFGGTVKAISQHVENPAGPDYPKMTTIAYTNGGREQSISFAETVSRNQLDPWHANPLTPVTEHLKAGDKFELSIAKDGQSASLTNTTEGVQTRVTTDGKEPVSQSIDVQKTKSLVPAL